MTPELSQGEKDIPAEERGAEVLRATRRERAFAAIAYGLLHTAWRWKGWPERDSDERLQREGWGGAMMNDATRFYQKAGEALRRIAESGIGGLFERSQEESHEDS